MIQSHFCFNYFWINTANNLSSWLFFYRRNVWDFLHTKWLKASHFATDQTSFTETSSQKTCSSTRKSYFIIDPHWQFCFVQRTQQLNYNQWLNCTNLSIFNKIVDNFCVFKELTILWKFAILVSQDHYPEISEDPVWRAERWLTMLRRDGTVHLNCC